MITPMQDLDGNIKCEIAVAGDNSGAPALVTAGGTGDGTEVTGGTIDRRGSVGGSLPDSGLLAIAWKAALTNTKTLSFGIKIQESADNSSWDTAEVLLAATVVKTAGSTTNFSDVYELAVDLAKRKRYVRFLITPDLSNTATDTCLWSAVLVMGGYRVSGDAV